MKKIDNYQIFFDLRDKYPEYQSIIGEIINYAFTHNDMIAEKYLYLGEYKDSFFEESIKLIFKELGLNAEVCLPRYKVNAPQLIVKLE